MLYFENDFLKFVEAETTYLFLTFIIVLFTVILVTQRMRRKRKKHPPGPMGLPFVGSVPFLGEEPHKTMAEYAKKYGNIFSIYMGMKYTVVLNDYEATKEGLRHPAALNKAQHLFDHIEGGAGFGTLNGEPWQEQRRFCMNAMRDLGLAKTSWQVLIHEEISSLINDLKALNGKPTDVTPMVNTSVSNNIVSLLIGRKLHKDTERDIIELFREFAIAALETTGPSHPAAVVPGLRKLLEYFKIAGYDKAFQTMKKANEFIKQEVNRHKSFESRGIQDFINRYLDKMEDVHDTKENQHLAFSEKMLEGNINSLFLGGSDTISSSLGYMMRLLAACPDLQKKIQEELDFVVGRDKKVEYEERNKTPFTFAALLEMERFATIVPLGSTRVKT